MTLNKSKEAWEEFLNRMQNARDLARKSSNPVVATCSGSGCCSSGCGKIVSCDEDDCYDCGGCDDCSCEKKKPNSKTIRDDGCFCRKCNEFLPMVEPDDERDGKALCYGCKNPW